MRNRLLKARKRVSPLCAHNRSCTAILDWNGFERHTLCTCSVGVKHKKPQEAAQVYSHTEDINLLWTSITAEKQPAH